MARFRRYLRILGQGLMVLGFLYAAALTFFGDGINEANIVPFYVLFFGGLILVPLGISERAFRHRSRRRDQGSKG